MEILALIPARGGSTRLPGKNIKLFNGKPLISYAIEQAQKISRLSRIIVLTDDDEISVISRKYGIRVVNEPALTHDDVKIPSKIQWLLNYLEKTEGYKPHLIVLLQPTSPLRTVEDIEKCLDIMIGNQADSLTSICPEFEATEQNPWKQNGAVYIFGRYLGLNGLFYGPNLFKYEMPLERSVDIDELEDFNRAERLMRGEKIVNTGILYKLENDGRGKADNQSGKGNKPGRPRKIPAL